MGICVVGVVVGDGDDVYGDDIVKTKVNIVFPFIWTIKWWGNRGTPLPPTSGQLFLDQSALSATQHCLPVASLIEVNYETVINKATNDHYNLVAQMPEVRIELDQV